MPWSVYNSNGKLLQSLAIGDDSIVEGKLDVSNAPTNGQFLQAQSGEGGGLTWAAAGIGDHSVSVTATGAQSLSNASGTLIAFGAEVFDTDAYHDNSTNNSRLTVPSGLAGKYIVTGTVRYTSNATGDRIAFLKIWDDSASATANLGHFSGALAQTSSNHHAITVTGIVDLDVGDFVELEGLQTSGGSLNTVHAEGAPTLSMVKLT